MQARKTTQDPSTALHAHHHHWSPLPSCGCLQESCRTGPSKKKPFGVQAGHDAAVPDNVKYSRSAVHTLWNSRQLILPRLWRSTGFA